ncbi:S66 family peptidase [Archangium lansingense]|uniref:LD-carboxypeptidase n=1 Tax=Archangium lansingense TaxID=2995310 RepID=A0ABT4AJB9_9BACT|nr:S66 peptidase family protein [Archangium lansinium]MCY1081671.1 LD-carboxypeptidase [Archangium lansinium]
MPMRKPARLQPGDTVAILSPSAGLPSLFPHTFDAGLAVLRERLGLRIREYPTTRASPEALARDPQARARDLHQAFRDEEVKAVIASIGGDDSVRLLPHLDAEVFARNPKVLMGYSDTTTLLTYVNRLGVVTFHGPSVMAGFAQASSLPASFLEHARAMLFEPRAELEYRPYGSWSDGYPDWRDSANATRIHAPQPDSEGFRFIQGRGVARGELFGGCIEVLEFMKGTRFWPEPEFWSGKLLFLETSEEKPSPEQVRRWLRNYGLQGVFERISGLLFGRPRSYSREEKAALEQVLLDVVAGEFGRGELPLVTNLDFGHTDPQRIVPLGVRAEVDCEARRLRLLEPAVL